MQELDRSGETVYGKKGSYSNLSLLGEGGFKVAYSAIDQHRNEVVVVFPTTVINGVVQDPSYHNQVLKSLGDEMYMLKNIVAKQQPHSIIRFIDESKNGSGFFVLEKGGDTDIQKKCKQNPLSQNEIVKISTDVLHGLNFLHRQQPSIIHRDIKPGNIMLKKDGSAVLIDFGTAKQGWDNIPKDQGNKTGFQSFGYSCPHYEAFVASTECDLYALGRVMFYMATGLGLDIDDPPGSKRQKYYAHQTILGKLSKQLHEIPNCHVTKEFSELVDVMCDPDHSGLTAKIVLSRLRTLSSSKPKPKSKPIRAAYHIQSGGGGSAQQNVYPPARIILAGIQHRISDYDDGMGNIIPANVLLGSLHDEYECQLQHEHDSNGCNTSDKTPGKYQGENIFVGRECPSGCRDPNCDNPSHVIGSHHLRIFRLQGEMFVINKHEKKYNKARDAWEERGRSAIFRAGRWIPMTHGKKEVLKNHDKVAFMWNRDKGDYMSFTFYTY
jgi:serine/threonine protein kinase